jgi:aspartyl-tRNA(Asn)/glutamyl-tRNA(Gln) amidotransferase subunit A
MTSPNARDRLEACLARIADPAGEGARAFTTLYAEPARDAAAASDARAMRGLSLGRLDGAIISIKDLFYQPGEVTLAGSKLLRDAAPATAEAPAIARLRAAGAVIIGKTNMTEFAFSGIGINPHNGTPGNPADRTRVPGGSSSGAAISVADGMAEIAIGTDTGGSTRIPAAFCGIVGWKPSQFRVPRDGAFPLSFALDSIGPLARSVADCVLADAAMAGEAIVVPEAAPLAGLRFGIPTGPLLSEIAPGVAAAFERAKQVLAKAGARLVEWPIADLLAQMAAVNARGGLVAPEAAHIHAAWLESKAAEFDPIVLGRIRRGLSVSAPDYVAMQRGRADLVAAMDARLEDVDALILPSVAVPAPKIADLAEEAAFTQANALILRNTAALNFFDLCAISLPMPMGSELPAGLMLAARNGQDKRLFRMALSVEATLV